MSLLELLRKSGSDGDVDFLKEALNVLVHSLMEAEVAAQISAERYAISGNTARNNSARSRDRPRLLIPVFPLRFPELFSIRFNPASRMIC